MRIETMARPVRTRCAGWRSRALASSLSALLVWTSAAPGIAAAQQAGVPLAVVHDPVTSGVAGEPLRIEARVASSGSRPFVVLHHRERGEGAYQDAIMPRVGIDGYLRELPTEAGVETTIEYWIEASADGATARAGSADDPIVADVAPAAATPPAPVADTRARTVVDRPSTALTAALKAGQTRLSEFDEEAFLGVEIDGMSALGANLGYEFTPTLAIELEYIEGGFVVSFGADETEFAIASLALYGAYRSRGALYFAARFGYLREEIEGLDFTTSSESGLSVGFGVGYRITRALSLELDYTAVEEDVDWALGAVRYRFFSR